MTKTGDLSKEKSQRFALRTIKLKFSEILNEKVFYGKFALNHELVLLRK